MYVPVLRWKRAERHALRYLVDDVRQRICPLIEVTNRTFVDPTEAGPVDVSSAVGKLAKEVVGEWGCGACFLDFHLLSGHPVGSDGVHALEAVCAAVLEERGKVIPVTGVARDSVYQDAVARVVEEKRTGVCIRVARPYLERIDFGSMLSGLMSRLGVDRNDTHIVLDLGIVLGDSLLTAEACAALPALDSWQTVTVLAGAFPKDLTGFKPGQHLHPRSDWLAWRGAVSDGWPLSRTPSFGDYTIQHPVFAEPPPRANFSASIRYTAEDDWVVMRGEGVFNDDGPGYAQWPANAQLLCERSEFCGEDFSYGDRYIATMARQTKKPGNPETWLLAGFSHHLTLVTRQIASLFAE